MKKWSFVKLLEYWQSLFFLFSSYILKLLEFSDLEKAFQKSSSSNFSEFRIFLFSFLVFQATFHSFWTMVFNFTIICIIFQASKMLKNWHNEDIEAFLKNVFPKICANEMKLNYSDFSLFVERGKGWRIIDIQLSLTLRQVIKQMF